MLKSGFVLIGHEIRGLALTIIVRSDNITAITESLSKFCTVQLAAGYILRPVQPAAGSNVKLIRVQIWINTQQYPLITERDSRSGIHVPIAAPDPIRECQSRILNRNIPN